MGLGKLNPGCTCCDCVQCRDIQFSEDFSSITWPDTWASEACLNFGGTPQYQTVSNGFQIVSGQLKSKFTTTPYSCAARQSIANGDWSCMSIEADVLANGSNWATIYVYISEARFFAMRNPFAGTAFVGGNFGYSSCGSGTFTFGTTNPFAGHLLLTLRRVSYGQYDIQYCFDGVLEYEELNQSLTFSDPMRFGVAYTYGAVPGGSDYITIDNVKFRAN